MARRKAKPADAVAEAARAAAKAAHEAAVANIILHFDTTYISNPSRLGAFQQLCKDLDVEVGASLKQCKKSVKQANVNIHDFVRVQQTGGDVSVIKFSSKAKLRQDMRDSPDRRFPLRRAKANELLNAMLIKV